MLGRRLLVVFAVLLGLTALATALAPRPTVRDGARVDPSSTPTATPAPERSETRSSRVERTISANPGRKRARVRVRVGDVLMLTVRGDLLDSVEIPDLAKLEPIEPGSPARFEMLLEEAGELRVGLVDAKRFIGLVEVAPGPS